jgi:thioredoxin 1
MAEVTEVTDNNFQAEVIESDVPVLVDFWAPWCGPCRRVSPIVEEIANERGDALKVVKLMVFRHGQQVKTVIGAYPKKKLEAEIDPVLA